MHPSTEGVKFMAVHRLIDIIHFIGKFGTRILLLFPLLLMTDCLKRTYEDITKTSTATSDGFLHLPLSPYVFMCLYKELYQDEREMGCDSDSR